MWTIKIIRLILLCKVVESNSTADLSRVSGTVNMICYINAE